MLLKREGRYRTSVLMGCRLIGSTDPASTKSNSCVPYVDPDHAGHAARVSMAVLPPHAAVSIIDICPARRWWVIAWTWLPYWSSNEIGRHQSTPVLPAGMQKPPDHIKAFFAPMADLPRSLDEDKDSEDDGVGNLGELDGDGDGGDAGRGRGSSGSDGGSGRGGEFEEVDDDMDVQWALEDTFLMAHVKEPVCPSLGGSSRGTGGQRRKGGPGGSGLNSEDASTVASGQEGAGAEQGGRAGACALCLNSKGVVSKNVMSCPCGSRFHIECLNDRWLAEAAACGKTSGGSCCLPAPAASSFQGLPEEGHCPCCLRRLTWMDLLLTMKYVPWVGKKRRASHRSRRAGAKGGGSVKGGTGAVRGGPVR